MKNEDATVESSFHIGSEPLNDELKRIKTILDAKYEPADLTQIVNQCIHLSHDEQEQLLNILKEFQHLFDGSLGKWKGRPYDIKIKEGAKPHHAWPYTIPKAYERTLCMDVKWLVKLRVLRGINHSEWAAPNFIIRKNDRTVRFITDF